MNETDFEKAKNKSLAYLSRHMYTKKELFDKLERAGFCKEIIDDVCVWALEYGFIDDKTYARTYIENAIASKKYGVKRIKQTLIYKGINVYDVEDILCEFDFNEKDNILPLIQKKLGGNFERKNIDKTIRHFLTKGYEFSDIKHAIDMAKESFDFGEDDDFET